MNFFINNRNNIVKNILGSFSTEEEQISKAIETAEVIEKGKRATLGETRTWKGGKYVKTSDGWKQMKESGEGTKKEDGGGKESEMYKKVMNEIKHMGILSPSKKMIDNFMQREKEFEKLKESFDEKHKFSSEEEDEEEEGGVY